MRARRHRNHGLRQSTLAISIWQRLPRDSATAPDDREDRSGGLAREGGEPAPSRGRFAGHAPAGAGGAEGMSWLEWPAASVDIKLGSSKLGDIASRTGAKCSLPACLRVGPQYGGYCGVSSGALQSVLLILDRHENWSCTLEHPRIRRILRTNGWSGCSGYAFGKPGGVGSKVHTLMLTVGTISDLRHDGEVEKATGAYRVPIARMSIRRR